MSMLYLVRHGETDYHLRKQALGRIDAELNPLGERQSVLVAEALGAKGIKAIYSSPLTRCRQTAGPLAEKLGLAVEPLDGLQEIDLGEWDGLPFSEIYEKGGEAFHRWMAAPAEVRIPGGEILGEVSRCVLEAARIILLRHSVEEDVAIFTHGGPLRLLLCHAMGLDINRIFRVEVDLASISAIKCFGKSLEEDAAAALINDTCHLGASRSGTRG